MRELNLAQWFYILCTPFVLFAPAIAIVIWIIIGIPMLGNVFKEEVMVSTDINDFEKDVEEETLELLDKNL